MKSNAMHRTKDYRLHQERKHKRRAKRFFAQHWRRREADERLIGMRASTRQPCSCWSCGNQRRAEGKTPQEIAADEEMQEELQDVFAYGYDADWTWLIDYGFIT